MTNPQQGVRHVLHIVAYNTWGCKDVGNAVFHRILVSE